MFDIKNFIEKHSQIPDLQFDPKLEPPLPINPYSKSLKDKIKIAHYFLIVASIDEGNLVRRAENARILVVKLYRLLKDDIFSITNKNLLEKIFMDCVKDLSLSRLKHKIPEIIVSVNQFVINQAENNLVKFAQKFKTPKEFVEILASNIVRMGKTSNVRKKAWMYMRWMVRDYPDLRIFDLFSPKDLFVPVDRNVLKAAIYLGIIPYKKSLQPTWKDVEKITQFGKILYPEDPVKIDYPLFLLGRELTKEDLKNPNNSLQ